MSKRKIKLDKHGISGKRYKELCGFCEQYPEWKQELANIAYPMFSHADDGMPHNPNQGTSDTTGRIAVKSAMLRNNVDLVERVAKQASTEFWQYIIKSVCYEVPVTYLISVDGLAMSRSVFYELRRYFFYLLDQNKDC